jgi:hypothetical protein
MMVNHIIGGVIDPFLPWNWEWYQAVAFVLLVGVIVGYVIWRKKQM